MNTYYESITDEQAIQELARMGIKFEPKKAAEAKAA